MKASKRHLEVIEKNGKRKRMFAQIHKKPGAKAMRKSILDKMNGRVKEPPAPIKSQDASSPDTVEPQAVKLESEDGSSC